MGSLKLKFHGTDTDTDTDILADFRANEDRHKFAGESRQKLCLFNSVNSEIIGRKFTKFGNDVAWLLPLNLLKAALRSANPLLNAKAKSKGRSTRRLRTSPNLTGCHSHSHAVTLRSEGQRSRSLAGLPNQLAADVAEAAGRHDCFVN